MLGRDMASLGMAMPDAGRGVRASYRRT